MNLAEKVASDFARNNVEMMEMIREATAEKKRMLHDTRVKGTAVQSLIGMLHLWIPRMERLDHPKNAQTAREMRDELRDLEKILNG